MPKSRIHIKNPAPDHCGHTDLSHARRLVRQKRAEWEGPLLVLLYGPSAPASLRHSPNFDLVNFRPHDSGRSGFTTYPQPSHGYTLAAKFPGIMAFR